MARRLSWCAWGCRRLRNRGQGEIPRRSPQSTNHEGSNWSSTLRQWRRTPIRRVPYHATLVRPNAPPSADSCAQTNACCPNLDGSNPSPPKATTGHVGVRPYEMWRGLQSAGPVFVAQINAKSWAARTEVRPTQAGNDRCCVERAGPCPVLSCPAGFSIVPGE